MTRSGGPVGLAVRRLEPEDAGALFALVDAHRAWLDPWMPWTDQVRSVEDVRRFVEDSLRVTDRGPRAHECGLWSGSALVGLAGLHRIDLVAGTAQVGYWLGQRHTGRGFATGGVRAVARFGFGVIGLHRLEIRAAAGNRASLAVARRAGFRWEGRLREAELHRGVRRDVVVLGRLASEPEGGAPDPGRS